MNHSSGARGFILQASYRIVSAPGGRRSPVVHIYGRLESGETFLVRDDRQRPHFYIRAADAARAATLGAPPPQPGAKHDFSGAPLCRLEVETPQDITGLRDRLQAAGVETFEADVRFALRYLIDRGIKGSCEIDGAWVPGSGGIGRIYTNPTLRPAALDIEPRVLSFDIETDGADDRLLAISLYAPGVDEVLIVDAGDRPMPERATRCADERAALDAFCARVRGVDPDVLTGWNVIDFDLTVLQRIAARLNHPFGLGREPGALRLRKAEGYFGSGQASIPGRLVLDGIDLLRGAFVRMEEYSLDAVARAVLGEGKAVAGDVRDRISEILQNYRHDLAAFALYARTDARLAFDILARLDLVRLAYARSRLTGMTPDRVAASIASFDFLYLTELKAVGIVAPSVRGGTARNDAAQQGGHVLEPAAGLHHNVWVFDFKSLYPSIIRTFNIDPLSYVQTPSAEADLIRTPGGAFGRTPAILPRMLDELFPRREAAKKAGDGVASNAIKILMNSFYGVLGTPACRFYNPALANSITGTGRELLLWAKSWFEAAGFRVLYGDTDSLFVESRADDPAQAGERGRELAVALNRELARHIGERWRVASRLELEFEKLYLKLFLPRARHSTRGASKRYAGLLSGVDAGAAHGGTVEFVGMEVVRRDWTALAKQVQRELYQRLFTEQSVDAYLADVVQKVRSGDLDDALVYRKNLRKDADEYTATTPPHVVAARKSTQAPGRLISYVMTTAGAEPLDNVRHALDREHYVLKQVKPVAEPVLAALGLDFERVIGDSRQIDLY
ncbi:MAG TPA: DNA polymerase II [Steroidobacteraceae bacterium]|nr:DNA polymerase II [Steroidobacteraceae bacterium]